MDGDVIIGFMDESSPQTTANTQRLWRISKNLINSKVYILLIP